MPKRAHGAGTVTAYKDGFQLKWSDPERGRGSKVVRPATRRQAEAALRAILSDIDRGVFTDERKGSVLFEDFVKDWMEWKQPQVKHSTYKVIQSHLNTMLLPSFAGKGLNAITRRSVDLWWSRNANHPVNRRNSYYALRGVFELAIDWNLLAATPCRIKDPGKDVAQLRPDWSVEDFDAVLTYVDAFYVPALEVMFGAHLRLGELIALNGADVRGGFVTVTKQKTGGGYTSDTKTGQHGTVELLERGRLALASLPAVIGDAPLFPGERAHRMPRTSLRTAWEKACEAAGLENFHVHDIRHVSLSLVAEAGVERKVIQQRARHSSPTSTDRYIHTSKRQHTQAVARVDEMVRRLKKTTAPTTASGEL